MDDAIPWKEQLAGLKILVVDDDESTRDGLRALLRIFGAAEVNAAASVSEALRVLISMKPDVLASDIGMPGEDGYALIQKVRALPAALGGQTPAIAVSAFTDPEHVARALSTGFQFHQPKPVNIEQLVLAIGQLARSSVFLCEQHSL